jgi:gliding motility-associated-like protein
VPSGTTYGQPASNSNNPTGATITVNADGTYSFSATVAGTYVYNVPVCAPGQTNSCPTETLTITVNTNVNPITKVLEVTKVAGSAIMNLDATYDISFVIKTQNLTKEFIESVLIKDDLTKVFSDTRGIKVVSVIASGGLVINANYDGIGNVDLVTLASSLEANKTDSIVLKINVANNTAGSFLNTAIASVPTSNGLVSVVSTDPSKMSLTDTTRKPTEFLIPNLDIKIPEGFSPNNDGIDDAWTITKPFGSSIGVKIFNRWGNEVYSNANYLNDWRGKGISNFLGEDLPEGTYFYSVEVRYRDGSLKKLAGSLTIKR